MRADAARNVRRILDAATKVLAYDYGAGMAEVAAEAGLARATLYRHFPTRAELVDAIRTRAYEDAGAAIAACHLEEGSAGEALRRLVEGLVAVGDRYRFLQYQQAASESAEAAMKRRADQLTEPVLAMIRRGQKSGELAPDVDPAWFTRTLDALLRSAARAVGEGQVTAGEAAELVYRTVTRGLGGPSA
jgi:AcrR family transcriptional regulator